MISNVKFTQHRITHEKHEFKYLYLLSIKLTRTDDPINFVHAIILTLIT